MWGTKVYFMFCRVAEARFALSANFLAIFGFVVNLSVVALISYERFV